MHQVKVWDGFIRFYHWGQLLLLTGLWWSAEQEHMLLHISLGLILLSLFVTRLIWGFIGSDTARLSPLFVWPSVALNEIKQELKGKPQPHLGHTASGGYMILTLMLLIAIQLISGLFNSDDFLADGPLYSYITEETAHRITGLHRQNFKLLLGFSALHILAISLFTWLGRGLIRPMLTGLRPSETASTPLVRSGWLGILLFIILLCLAFWLDAERLEEILYLINSS